MILSAAVYWQARLPDEYALTRGGSLRLPGNITAVYGEETAVARSGEATAEAQLRLPLGVSVKTVSVRYVQRDTVLGFVSVTPLITGATAVIFVL